MSHKGVLYHVEKIGKGDEMEHVLQVAVPAPLRYELARRYHRYLGHPKAKRLCSILKTKYWWEFCLRDCQLVVDDCQVCDRYSHAKIGARARRRGEERVQGRTRSDGTVQGLSLNKGWRIFILTLSRIGLLRRTCEVQRPRCRRCCWEGRLE